MFESTLHGFPEMRPEQIWDLPKKLVGYYDIKTKLQVAESNDDLLNNGKLKITLNHNSKCFTCLIKPSNQWTLQHENTKPSKRDTPISGPQNRCQLDTP